MNFDKINNYRKLADEYMINALKAPIPALSGIYDAMLYSVKNGGKRVRPVLAMMFCEASGGNPESAVPLACAVEFVHTYSLIHDDLPCMDNDDYRRGKLSNHKVFGEANAVLAGDGLLTAAFSLISDGAEKGLYSSGRAVAAVKALSSYAGASGMVGGQFIDLAGEGEKLPKEKLELMDRLKTGALIASACVLGCIAANADDKKIKAAEDFAYNLGIAFQIRDDILDVTGNTETLGKLTESDSENEKSTYVSLYGLETCEELVNKLTDRAIAALAEFENGGDLKDFALYLSKREK